MNEEIKNVIEEVNDDLVDDMVLDTVIAEAPVVETSGKNVFGKVAAVIGVIGVVKGAYELYKHRNEIKQYFAEKSNAKMISKLDKRGFAVFTKDELESEEDYENSIEDSEE